jgi:hypothetical protein
VSIPVKKYRQWAQIFRDGGAVYLRRDGLNHHVWGYTPAGTDQQVTVGIAAHSDGAEVPPVYIQSARRYWKLTKRDGVSDHDFLAGNWRRG